LARKKPVIGQKLHRDRESSLLRSHYKIVNGYAWLTTTTFQKMPLCGAPCTCEGEGCGLVHPGGMHCEMNPVCPEECKGSCQAAAGHERSFAQHSCTHGHGF
jgi:hypothetical protein